MLLVAFQSSSCTAPPQPTPTVEVPSTPAGTPMPGQGVAWEIEWERTLARGKEEGKVVVAGPPGDSWQRVLHSFQAEFPEIQVEYTGLTTGAFFSQLRQERQAGVYAWDLRIGSVDAEAYRARDEGSLDPVRPLIFHGDALDDTKWVDGFDALFELEPERRWFAGFLLRAAPTAWVNRDVVPVDELNSARDLVDPRWRGQIVLLDPRREVGLDVFTLLVQAYGEAFMRDLLDNQEVIITADAREQSDWVIRGVYPIGVGYTTDLARRFLLEGLIVRVHPVADGPIGVSTGDGSIQVINRPPHPSAAKLFANWLLTPKAQDLVASTVGVNSRRLDVFAGDPLLRPNPEFLDQLICHVCENMLPVRAEARRLANELIP